MPIRSIEDIDIGVCSAGSRHASRLWREWCFVRVAFRHFRVRFLLMTLILVGGGVILRLLDERHNASLLEAIYHTWAMVFGEMPADYPRSTMLQVLFFLVPILGITVIIEGVIDFALMLRDRRRFERSWCIMLANSYRDHIVLVGLGRLGYRTFLLLRKMGEAVVVIERDEQNQFLEDVRRDGSPLFVGDARREALLEDANIASAKSIVLATNDDMANLEIALDARQINATLRVVLRMFDQNMADKVGGGFDIHMAMSQSAISAPSFATSAVEPSIVTSSIVHGHLVVMQRWLVREAGPLAGMTLQEVVERFRVNVVEYRRAGDEPELIPPLSITLALGDAVVVQAPYEHIAQLRDEALGPLAAE